MTKIGVFTITIINLFWHMFQSSVSSACIGVCGGRTFNVGKCVAYPTRTVGISKCPGGVRPSLVPMRDLVPTIDGARVDSGTGRTGARREDGAWDLGKRR